MFEEQKKELRDIVRVASSHRVVMFLCIFEFLQKFAYHGLLGSLFLFLKHELKMELYTAIGVFHAYVGLSFLLPLLGTLLADNYVNRVITLLIMTSCSIFGFLFMILSAVVSAETYFPVAYAFDRPVGFAMFGLFLIALGGGVLKEVTIATGDAQFDEKDATDRRNKPVFHQILHYAIAGGSVSGMIFMPLIRTRTECFDTMYCYMLAFFIPMMFLAIAMGVLMYGYNKIKKVKPGVSAMVEFTVCIGAALNNLCSGGEHWVDNASYRFINEFLDDVKDTLHVLALFIPLPMFWALFSQIGSRFVYLNTLFNGTVSFDQNLYVEPDHLQAINPLFILIFMPLYERYFNPALRNMKCCGTTMKQRLFLGAMLAAVAFLVAGGIEWHFAPKRNDLDLPQEKEGDLIIFNLRVVYELPPVELTTNITGSDRYKIQALDFKRLKKLPVEGVKPFTFVEWEVSAADKCNDNTGLTQQVQFLVEKKLIVIVLLDYLKHEDKIKGCHPLHFAALDVSFKNWDRCDLQLPKLGIIYNLHRAVYNVSDSIEYNNPTYDLRHNFTFKLNEKDRKNNMVNRITKNLDPNHSGLDFFHVRPSLYSIFRFDNSRRTHFRLRRGGVYIAMYTMNYQPPNKTSHFLSNITTFLEPQLASTMWILVPHHLLLCAAQFLYPITLLEYAYAQVPILMKPVVLSFWMISIAVGNFITCFFSISNMFTSELANYLFFAALMGFNCVLLFMFLCNYIPTMDYFAGDSRYVSAGSETSQRSGDGESTYDSDKNDDDDDDDNEEKEDAAKEAEQAGDTDSRSRRKKRVVKFNV